MIVLQKDELFAVQDKQRNLVVIEEDGDTVSVYYNNHVYLIEGDAIESLLCLGGLIDAEGLKNIKDNQLCSKEKRTKSYLEELLLEFRKGAKIRRSNWPEGRFIEIDTTGKFIVDNNNRIYTIFARELLADNWELYQEPIKGLEYYSDTAKVSAPDPVDIGFSVVGMIDISIDKGQLRAISDVPEVQKRIINFFSRFCW